MDHFLAVETRDRSIISAKTSRNLVFFKKKLSVLLLFCFKWDFFTCMQIELLSSAVYMRTGRIDYLCDGCVDTIVAVTILIFEPIQGKKAFLCIPNQLAPW